MRLIKRSDRRWFKNAPFSHTRAQRHTSAPHDKTSADRCIVIGDRFPVRHWKIWFSSAYPRATLQDIASRNKLVSQALLSVRTAELGTAPSSTISWKNIASNNNIAKAAMTRSTTSIVFRPCGKTHRCNVKLCNLILHYKLLKYFYTPIFNIRASLQRTCNFQSISASVHKDIRHVEIRGVIASLRIQMLLRTQTDAFDFVKWRLNSVY